MKRFHTKQKSAALLITLLIVSSLGLMALTMLKSSIVQLIANTQISDSIIAEEASRAGLEKGLADCKDYAGATPYTHTMPTVSIGSLAKVDIIYSKKDATTCLVSSDGYVTTSNIHRKHHTNEITMAAPIDNPPTISITNPADGSTISSGPVSITATATDDHSISKVEFTIDGTLKSTDTTSPYDYSWDITGYANGSHTIIAKAYDSINQTATDTHSVTISTLPHGRLVLAPASPDVANPNPPNTPKWYHSAGLFNYAVIDDGGEGSAATSCTGDNIYSSRANITVQDIYNISDAETRPGVPLDPSAQISQIEVHVWGNNSVDTYNPFIQADLNIAGAWKVGSRLQFAGRACVERTWTFTPTSGTWTVAQVNAMQTRLIQAHSSAAYTLRVYQMHIIVTY